MYFKRFEIRFRIHFGVPSGPRYAIYTVKPVCFCKFSKHAFYTVKHGKNEHVYEKYGKTPYLCIMAFSPLFNLLGFYRIKLHICSMLFPSRSLFGFQLQFCSIFEKSTVCVKRQRSPEATEVFTYRQCMQFAR